MEPAFWSIGAIPGRLLDALALPRPVALAAVLAALAKDRFAVVSGPPGCGKSTLALQAAASLHRSAIVVASDALLTGDEEDHRARLDEEAAAARRARVSGWDGVGQALGLQEPILVLDGLDAAQMDWARTLPVRSALQVIVVGPPGGIEPEPVSPEASMGFLDRRCRQAGKSWTPGALRDAADLAADSPEDLQRVGACCLLAAMESRKTRIGLEVLLEGSLAAAHPLPPGHARQLATVPETRLALLKARVRFPEDGPTGWAGRCGLEPKAAVVHLRRLEHGDRLVARVGHGDYRIRSPLVRLHLQSRFGTAVRTLSAPAPAR